MAEMYVFCPDNDGMQSIARITVSPERVQLQNMLIYAEDGGRASPGLLSEAHRILDKLFPYAPVTRRRSWRR